MSGKNKRRFIMVKVKWFGHSAFMLRSSIWSILIDPFFTGNPKTDVKADDIKADFILVTHGHGDHLGDAIEISKRCSSVIIAPNELAIYASSKGAKVRNMHIGGSANLPFGKVKLTQAFHGSSIVDEKGNIIYCGMPCGFLIEMENKITYHAGDTALFGDMALIPGKKQIDLALLPIGDNFTMGVEDAALAVELLKPKIVVPMHYGPWDIIDTSPDEFAGLVKTPGTSVIIMKPGDEIEI